MHSYDARNPLHLKASAKNMNSFVDPKHVYKDHVVSRRDSEDDSQTDKCKEFKQGNPERREFYSPNYPANYTNHTECVKLLEGR